MVVRTRGNQEKPAVETCKQERVYRKWRCLPGREGERFDGDITGHVVEERFRELLAAL